MDDETAADQFCEEDIDQILQRRTQVITVDSGVKGSTFAKATFATAGTRDDIALDDPDFWEKWAKKVHLWFFFLPYGGFSYGSIAVPTTAYWLTMTIG